MDGECQIPAAADTVVPVDKSDSGSNFYLAGVILAVAVVLFLYHLIGKFRKCVMDYFTVSVCVSGGMINYYSGDKLYHFLLAWLSENLKELKHYSLSIKTRESENGKEDEIDLKFYPSFGTHIFRYKGEWVKLVREQTPEIICHEVPYERITLTAVQRNANLLNEILMEAKGLSRETDKTKTSFFVISCGDWSVFGLPKKRRQLRSVILAKGMEEKIVGDIKDFLESETWYRDRGIPYRRGYLLHGSPGCGKSSLIKAVAGEIGYDICMLSLSAKDLTDDGLNQLMNGTPARSIILLEDIDAAFKSRDDYGATNKETSLAFEGAGTSKVTFRGLLNALDGVASTEGRLVFMTTNYVDRLDPALARPGRVDVKILVQFPDEDQVQRMFARFYPDADASIKKKFAELVMGLKKNVSMAMIQGLFMMHKTSETGAFENAVEYFEDQYFSTHRRENVEESKDLEIETEKKGDESKSRSEEKEKQKLKPGESVGMVVQNPQPYIIEKLEKESEKAKSNPLEKVEMAIGESKTNAKDKQEDEVEKLTAQPLETPEKEPEKPKANPVNKGMETPKTVLEKELEENKRAEVEKLTEKVTGQQMDELEKKSEQTPVVDKA